MEGFWIEHWIELLFVLLTLTVSALFTVSWDGLRGTKKKRAEKKEKEDEALAKKILDQVEIKLGSICSEASLLHTTLIAALRRNFRKDCKRYLNRGYITVEELGETQSEWEIYQSLGGNGRCEELYRKVLILPVVKRAANADDIEIFVESDK